MKPALFSILILSSLSILSCTKDTDDTGTNTQEQQQAVTTGSWRVSLFTDSGDDETADFNGFTFQFHTDGSMTATRNGITQNGTWNIGNSSTRFYIDMGPKTDSNKPLGELTDDWVVLSISGTEIRLADDNTASDEFLTFTKN